MPWDETDQYIRSGHKDPDQYEMCRTTKISEDEGIKAIYCKLKGGDHWEIQSYLFAKEKGWTRDKAKEWFKRHEASAFPLQFFASVQNWEEKEGKHYARFYIMDTSLNKNNWRVTDEALEKALDTLVGKPLTAKLGYHINHVSNPIEVGKFTQASKKDGYALGLAEITDLTAWEKIKNSEWKPVSVEITADKVVCSKCGQDVLDEPDEHIKSGEAHEVIEAFKFNRVAFVSEPAYPRAGILAFDGLEQTGLPNKGTGLTAKREGGVLGRTVVKFGGVIPFDETPKAPEETEWDFNAANYDVDQLRRACAWYDSEDPDVKESYKLPHHFPDGRVVWRGVAAAMGVLMGARGGVDIPSDDRHGVYNHLAKHYAQFEKEPPEFQASMNHSHECDKDKKIGGEGEMDEKIAELQTKLEAVTAENKQLKAQLDRIEEKRHLERVAEIADLRVQAGLTKDRNAEIERLKGFDEKTLELLKSDTESFIAEKQRMARLAGPKARFTAGHEDEVKQKVEETRMRFFGHRNSPGEGGAD